VIGLTHLAFTLLLAAAGGEPGPGPAGFDFQDAGGVDLDRRLAGLGATDSEKPQQEDPRPQRPQEPLAPPPQEGSKIIDFEWMELIPRVGLAAFSPKYHINASPTFEIEARAPLVLLSPSSNPDGDYFGVFAQLNVTSIKRTIEPTLDKPSGMMASLGFGIDYTFFRNDTWLLLARLGLEYTTYGGVSDLKNGGQVMIGLTTGLSLSRSMVLTVTPEVMYAKTGDYLLLGLVGIAVEF
jgi:hypothetical protein